MAAKVLFTCAEDQILLELVPKFSCLYDLANPNYKNQTAKDRAWKKISENIGRSVGDCKKRWRNIKDTHQKRKRKGKGTESSTASKQKPWPLSDMLMFLDKAHHKRRSRSKTQFEGSSEENETEQQNAIEETDPLCISETFSSVPQVINCVSTLDTCRTQTIDEQIVNLLEDRHNERNEILKSLVQKQDDDIDMFFKSIAMSVKKLAPVLVNEAKLKSLKMLIDLEARNLVLAPAPTNSHSSQSTHMIKSDVSSN